MLKISDEIAGYVTELFPEEKTENKITRLIEYELRRKLARYQLIIRNLETKYHMDFQEFKANKMTEKKSIPLKSKMTFAIGNWHWTETKL